VGDDGVAIVDDQFAPLAPKIRAALAQLSPKPVKFVINTHWHLDHVGGNAAFADTATIFAHENVRKRMQAGAELYGVKYDPAAPAALPVVTFEQGLSLWWNGEEIRAIHVTPGHTDGDTVIWFTKSNVVHMGDDFIATIAQDLAKK
jgi:glyoxylase-like metal-dependent hydrolase (beta-lactamase superfamily II)